MKYLRDQNGVALITALMLTLLALVMVFAVLYMVTAGIRASSSQKQYRNTLEASYGGADFIARDLLPQIFLGYTTSAIRAPYAGIGLSFDVSNNCLRDKLTKRPGSWSACPSASLTSEDPRQVPDLRFTLRGNALTGEGYTVFSKIVDSIPGNSDMSGVEMLDSGSGVTGGSSGISPQHLPGTYRIEIAAEKSVNPSERSRLSILYAY